MIQDFGLQHFHACPHHPQSALDSLLSSIGSGSFMIRTAKCLSGLLKSTSLGVSAGDGLPSIYDQRWKPSSNALTRYWHMEKEVNGGYSFDEAELSGLLKAMVRLSLDVQRRNDNFPKSLEHCARTVVDKSLKPSCWLSLSTYRFKPCRLSLLPLRLMSFQHLRSLIQNTISLKHIHT